MPTLLNLFLCVLGVLAVRLKYQPKNQLLVEFDLLIWG